MSVLAAVLALSVRVAGTQVQIPETEPDPQVHHIPQLYNQHIATLDGELVEFLKYRGKVLLIANLASRCGYTESGYEQLNALHKDYFAKGLRVLGFPCNQFGQQEPGTSDEIAKFAQNKGAEFEIFEKVAVNGPQAHEVFKLLKGEHTVLADACKDDHPECEGWANLGECDKNPGYMLTNCMKSCKQCAPMYKFGGDIQWNFEYFLVGRKGHVVARFRTGTNLTSKEARRIIENELEGMDDGKDEL